jgi:hypothetical protein
MSIYKMVVNIASWSIYKRCNAHEYDYMCECESEEYVNEILKALRFKERSEATLTKKTSNLYY